jgi:hypothetical protein
MDRGEVCGALSPILLLALIIVPRSILPTTALSRVMFASHDELLLYFTPTLLPEGIISPFCFRPR